jgi:peptidyl-prolyl cis-trans isomerase A (cyclophilin A)
MPKFLAGIALALFALTVRGAELAEIRVVLETSRGEIELALDPIHAPATTANFLRYVATGLYDQGVFHRTVTPDNQPDKKIRIEVIQAGIDPTKAKLDGKPIVLERTRDTGLQHIDGAIDPVP